ncbi:MAG: FAD-dependent oxidoreductase [Verrucomicrobiae bacterium]|nr:FAD-dependent oxidoreductase [Verrucomicrobiae bacterium]
MSHAMIKRRDWLWRSGAAAGAWATGAVASRGAGDLASKTVGFHREVPVRHEVDVFVAGGGPAGVAAAVSARKQGANVYLAEAHTCLGGMGTAARVPTFMTFTDGVHFLAGGFGREVHERMKKDSTTSKCGHIDTEALKRVYDALMAEAGVGFTFLTTLVAVEAEGGHISHVVCAAPSGLFAVRAKVYVDATGNGDLATWAGAKFEKGDAEGNLMPGTLCSVWSEIDWETWRANRPAGPQPDGHWLPEAFAAGVFTVPDEHLTGMHRTGERLGAGNIGHTFGVDATDEVSLTRALIFGRKSMKEFVRYYREYVPGFAKAELVATGSLLGVRETRRIMGDYVLSLEDYRRRASFPDEIGRYSYPIDNHPLRPGKDTYEQHRKEFDETLRYAKGESYGIPYRTLTPRGLGNVLVAGRCVSADRMVHGSIRVMPGCFITGQAAGVAAAIAASGGRDPRAIDVADLRRRLRELGAYLPS